MFRFDLMSRILECYDGNNIIIEFHSILNTRISANL